MEQTFEERLALWEKEVLMPLVTELKDKIETLRSRPITEFNKVVTPLLRQATLGSLQMFNLESWERFSLQESAELMRVLVGSFNAALPLDYPFVIVMVFSSTTTNVRMAVLHRRAIPGIHELTKPDIVPILNIRKPVDLENLTDLNPPPIQYVEYFTGDDLERLFRL